MGRDTCNIEEWWAVWETFIRMSTYLMLKYCATPRQEPHPNLSWTDEMIVFEIKIVGTM